MGAPMMRVSQASEVLYGTHAGLDAGFTSVSTDSRTIQPGALFVALRGEKFDGHDFIAAVARSGGSNGQAAADEKKLALLRRALEIVAEQKPATERTVALLELFATL